ncbi:MAG: Sua5 family C-terminal domain-containing protein, partial [Phycisphaerae bacterium]
MQERTVITLADDPATYARELYTALRTLDAMALDAIYVQMPPDAPEWAAVRDRLRRATRELPA